MNSTGKINILVTFVFSKEEVDNNKHLLSFIPSGIVKEERAPFMFFTNELYQMISQKKSKLCTFYYPWESYGEEKTLVELAEILIKMFVYQLSEVPVNANEYFIFAIDHPHISGLKEVIESFIQVQSDFVPMNVVVVDPFDIEKSGGVMMDARPFLEGGVMIKIDFSRDNLN
jgi:hypothetical protein